MHGTTGGRELKARYYCSTRRANHSCDQPIAHAERIESQLLQFIAGFTPNPNIREETCAASQTTAHPRAATPPADAPRWKSACDECATYTNSATWSAPNTSRAATPSTPS
jgi:hypothetical protein